jgi:ribosomal protein S27AE
MTCFKLKNGFLCGEFTPADGKWHRLSYSESVSRKCDRCPFCAHYVLYRARKRTRRLCGKCLDSTRREP